MSFHEKVVTLPDRHPYPVKCMLGLMFMVITEASSAAMHAVLRRMGWIEMKLSTKIGEDAFYVNRRWVLCQEETPRDDA